MSEVMSILEKLKREPEAVYNEIKVSEQVVICSKLLLFLLEVLVRGNGGGL